MNYIHYMEPSYDCNEVNATHEYMLSGGWLTEFEKTRSFEAAIAQYTKMQYCSVMTNGSVTLIAALMACGIKKGDHVIVPDFTMSATSHAVKLIGAEPIFVDVEPETLCMDFECMKAAMSSKVKAVIFVNLNGRVSLRFDEILDYCKQYNIYLIEDAAQALGSTYKGKAMGTFGDIGSYSFSMPKIITTGQGGAVVTNHSDLMHKMLQIRDFGREKAGSDHYVSLGLNFKFTDLQAVIGLEQMKKLKNRVGRKKQIAVRYYSQLKEIPQITLLQTDLDEVAPCFIEILCQDREKLREYLENNKIGTRYFYPPLHAEPAYQLQESFPVTEKISSMGLWLPSSSVLLDEQIDFICEMIRAFYIKG